MEEIEWTESSRATSDDFVCKESVMDLGRPKIDIAIARLDDSFTNDEMTSLYNSIGFGIVWGNANVGNRVVLHELLKCTLDFTAIVSDDLGNNSVAANDFFPKEFARLSALACLRARPSAASERSSWAATR